MNIYEREEKVGQQERKKERKTYVGWNESDTVHIKALQRRS